ncbi:MAG: hypothetical protein JNL07_03075, partial [Rhodospirillales bacterium]|nr:hypothetical protein [Rhodospirillales bacterium]
PTLILRAETGSATRATAAVQPSTIVETLPGTTHFLPMERPDVVRERLAAALEARDAALT